MIQLENWKRNTRIDRRETICMYVFMKVYYYYQKLVDKEDLWLKRKVRIPKNFTTNIQFYKYLNLNQTILFPPKKEIEDLRHWKRKKKEKENPFSSMERRYREMGIWPGGSVNMAYFSSDQLFHRILLSQLSTPRPRKLLWIWWKSWKDQHRDQQSF